jgi:hypothetical protein
MDLEIKQHIRDFFEGKMQAEREKARIFNTIPALIIRDVELEHFINELWLTTSRIACRTRTFRTCRRNILRLCESLLGISPLPVISLTFKSMRSTISLQYARRSSQSMDQPRCIPTFSAAGTGARVDVPAGLLPPPEHRLLDTTKLKSLGWQPTVDLEEGCGAHTSGTKQTMEFQRYDEFSLGTRIQYGGAVIGQEEVDAILQTIQEGNGRNWTIGKKGEEFESVLSQYTGRAYTLLTNSGSPALLLALKALNLPKGALVALPATTFPTAFNAIVQAGGVPLLIDTAPRPSTSLLISPQDHEAL